MTKRSPFLSLLVHLRIPFSFFLLPIFLFALGAVDHPDAFKAWAAFFIIHFLLYPASHAFNTWYDRDEGSIGGIRVPPPVPRGLFAASWVLDALALGSAFFLVGVFFGGCLTLYTLGSKLYSWDKTRFKKRPWGGWVGVGLVQGSLTFLAVVQSVGTPRSWLEPLVWLGALIAAVFLWGVYPLTQVYQHEEDARRGDMTLSLRLGVRGTFYLSGAFFLLSGGLFVLYYGFKGGLPAVFGFLAFQCATLGYFLYWAFLCFKNPKKADFGHAMVMNLMASGLMNAFLLLEIFL